jgi:hypothetical protein
LARSNEVIKNQRLSEVFEKLPQRIKETAKKNYKLWRKNPSHLSLEFKEVKPKENIWSVRVEIGWRALGVIKAEEEKIVWF